MMIRIGGTRGMMTSTISADTISRRGVLGIETVTIRGIIDGHMLHTTSRDVINLLNFPQNSLIIQRHIYGECYKSKDTFIHI